VTTLRRRAALAVLVFATILIAGCATPARSSDPFGPESSHWQGRLSIKVQGPSPQAVSASFELSGNAQAGQLLLTTPLGSTLAQLQWEGALATLQTSGEPQHFASLEALVRHTTGTDLPVAALFDWLRGTDSPAAGWEADLSDIGNGRLSARRLDAQAPAELKIILDR